MAVEYEYPKSESDVETFEPEWDSIERRDGAIIKTKIEQGEPDKDGWCEYSMIQISDPDPTQHPDYGSPWTKEEVEGTDFRSSGFGAISNPDDVPKLRPLIYINSTRYNTDINVYGYNEVQKQLIDLGALDDPLESFYSDPKTCISWDLRYFKPTLWTRIKLWFKKVFDKIF